MKLTITLPDEALKAMASQEEWTGSGRVRLQPADAAFAPDSLVIHVGVRGAKARAAASKDARSARRAESYRLSATEELLLAAWNDSEFVREHAAGESRNHPLPPSEVPKHLPTMRKALAEFGLDGLLASMETYFSCCIRREHLWDDRNHGYGHLGGFLRAMARHAKDKKQLWWMKAAGTETPIPDDRPELTASLADAYAARFLGRKAYGLKNPSADYGRFMAAAGKIAAWAERQGWPEGRATKALLDAVADGWQLGGTPPPGALGSERTWKALLPAHLKRLYG